MLFFFFVVVVVLLLLYDSQIARAESELWPSTQQRHSLHTLDVFYLPSHDFFPRIPFKNQKNVRILLLHPAVVKLR